MILPNGGHGGPGGYGAPKKFTDVSKWIHGTTSDLNCRNHLSSAEIKCINDNPEWFANYELCTVYINGITLQEMFIQEDYEEKYASKQAEC